MLFQTTQAHEELRAKIRAFAEEEIKPIAFMLDQQNEFPDEAIRKLGELGLMGIPFPKEYGGAGLDALSYAIAVEELARVDGGAGVILSAHVSLGSWPIFAYGTEAQKQKYLVPLAKGEKIGAFGLTEPNAGSDAGGTETTAVLKGDHYVLNGGKIFITNAPKADTYVVFAVTTPDIGTRGISAFIVEKGWEGFYFGDHYDKMGIRSSSTAELIFDNVQVKIAMSTLDGGRIGIAAQALGIAQGAYDAAVDYAKERIQFGKPIGFQQAISFKLADMATKLRCARFLVYSAAELKEAHVPYGMESAMAKMYASDIALEVTNDALQIHGGAGFMKGMEVERAYRDAKITTIYEGTNEIQRVVIASHILGKPPKSAGGSASRPKKPAPITGIRKIVGGEDLVSPGALALAAAVVSIVVKEAMFWYTRAAARRIDSSALMAEAWHHRSDALSSVGSFAGILGARLGWPVLDPIASVVICLFILKAAWDILTDALERMTDHACDPKLAEEMESSVLSQPGVLGVDALNTRLFGDRIYVDVEIRANGELTLNETHATAQAVHDALEAGFPQVKHCMVHVNPARVES